MCKDCGSVERVEESALVRGMCEVRIRVYPCFRMYSTVVRDNTRITLLRPLKLNDYGFIVTEQGLRIGKGASFVFLAL